jgi:hypothetical protein
MINEYRENVNVTDFINGFRSMGSGVIRDNFTAKGLRALFDYLNELERDCGITIEVDEIGLCCDFAEYENFEEFQGDYSNLNIEKVEDINDHTTLIAIENSNSFIIQQF